MTKRLVPPLNAHLVSQMPCTCAELYKHRLSSFHTTWISAVGGEHHHPSCDVRADGWVVISPNEEWARLYVNRPRALEALVSALCALGLHHRCAEIAHIDTRKGGEYNVFRLGVHGDPWLVISMSTYRRVHA